MKPPVARFVMPLALAFLTIAISGLGDYGRQTFEYLGPSNLHHTGGLSYRWLSGHFTHLSWSHTWLNLAGLMSIWVVYGRVITHKSWLAFIILCAFGISAGLHFLSPEVERYVGFSGVLHGMLALCAAYGMMPNLKKRMWSRTSIKWEDAFVFFGLWCKVVYEQMLGAVPMTAAIAGDSVIVNAHLYGACLGTIFALLLIVKHRLDHKN